jgi:flagellin
MFVNTNVSALNAQRQLFNSSNSLNTSFERLSSGMRINRASDDAAGLQITDRMTTQINGLNQAVSNANDAISLTQTAEGALGETTNALQRIRQLAVQSQNGINSQEDRDALQKEVSALKSEITRIADNTEFNGTSILDGSLNASFLVGANRGQTIDVTLGTDFDAAGLAIDTLSVSSAGGAADAMSAIDGAFSANFLVGANAGQNITVALALTDGFGQTGLGISALSVSSAGGASAAMASIDTAIDTIGGARADLGALTNRFQSTIRNLSNVSENLSAARSQIRDTDFAAETSKLTQMQIIQQASTTILSQANQRPQSALQLLG